MKGDEIKYSYWSNFNNSRNKNIGWRIDYFIVSPSLKGKLIIVIYLQKLKEVIMHQ